MTNTNEELEEKGVKNLTGSFLSEIGIENMKIQKKCYGNVTILKNIDKWYGVVFFGSNGKTSLNYKVVKLLLNKISSDIPYPDTFPIKIFNADFFMLEEGNIFMADKTFPIPNADNDKAFSYCIYKEFLKAMAEKFSLSNVGDKEINDYIVPLKNDKIAKYHLETVAIFHLLPFSDAEKPIEESSVRELVDIPILPKCCIEELKANKYFKIHRKKVDNAFLMDEYINTAAQRAYKEIMALAENCV